MLRIRKNQLLTALILALFVIGCNSNDPAPSAKEELQEALVNNTWAIDVANSNISGVTGSPDVATTTIMFTKTESGATFTFGGDIAAQVFGGGFDIADSGNTANPSINVHESLVVHGVTIVNAKPTNFKLSFTTGVATGRAEGVGEYVLSFNAN